MRKKKTINEFIRFWMNGISSVPEAGILCGYERKEALEIIDARFKRIHEYPYSGMLVAIPKVQY